MGENGFVIITRFISRELSSDILVSIRNCGVFRGHNKFHNIEEAFQANKRNRTMFMRVNSTQPSRYLVILEFCFIIDLNAKILDFKFTFGGSTQIFSKTSQLKVKKRE